MIGWTLSGIAILIAITLFVVLVRRQLRWSHPANGRGPAYVERSGADDVPVTVKNPSAPSGFGGSGGF